MAHEVVHNLFVGGREPQYPDTYGLIVSVQGEAQDDFLVPRTGPLYLWVPVLPLVIPTLTRITLVVHAVIEALYGDLTVLIHSGDGHVRAPLFGAATVMRILGASADQAIAKIKEKVPECGLTSGHRDLLSAYEAQLIQEEHDSEEVSS